MSDRLVDRTYRVGFQHSPPRQYVAADGTPYGPNIDILREAAARAHVRLEWVPTPEGPDKALKTGVIDLWPIVASLPERERDFFITEPFTQVTYWLVANRASGITTHNAISGKKVGYTAGLTGQHSRTSISRVPSWFNNPAGHKWSKQYVRSGWMQCCSPTAPLMRRSFKDSRTAKTVFRFVPFPGSRLWFGVGASRKNSRRDSSSSGNPCCHRPNGTRRHVFIDLLSLVSRFHEREPPSRVLKRRPPPQPAADLLPGHCGRWFAARWSRFRSGCARQS